MTCPGSAITKSRSALEPGIGNEYPGQPEAACGRPTMPQSPSWTNKSGVSSTNSTGSGCARSTAIVFTSDHGYHLGEHDFWEKANLHEEVTRVPLIVSAPGFAPHRTESIVELVDIFPTLADLAGLDIPASVQGKSLRPILVDRDAVVKQGALSFGQGTALRTSRWAYMRYDDDAEELYDMQDDPQQFDNLAQVDKYQDQLRRLRERLDDRLNSISGRAATPPP